MCMWTGFIAYEKNKSNFLSVITDVHLDEVMIKVKVKGKVVPVF